MGENHVCAILISSTVYLLNFCLGSVIVANYKSVVGIVAMISVGSFGAICMLVAFIPLYKSCTNINEARKVVAITLLTTYLSLQIVLTQFWYTRDMTVERVDFDFIKGIMLYGTILPWLNLSLAAIVALFMSLCYCWTSRVIS